MLEKYTNVEEEEKGADDEAAKVEEKELEEFINTI